MIRWLQTLGLFVRVVLLDAREDGPGTWGEAIRLALAAFGLLALLNTVTGALR